MCRKAISRGAKWKSLPIKFFIRPSSHAMLLLLPIPSRTTFLSVVDILKIEHSPN